MLFRSVSDKALYLAMLETTDQKKRKELQASLVDKVKPGSIDVNIMTKLDRQNLSPTGETLPDRYSDALSGLRGFAKSDLESGVVFSAGFNRRLYAYLENFDDFYPDETGKIKKRVIMKVSDYRSSLIQGRFLAKKGIWISEHRVESGLNCGGHAFASDGYLLGPILEEFKVKRAEFLDSIFSLCNNALKGMNKHLFPGLPKTEFTVQGGIGTTNEDRFLRDYYQLDRTGWATPFLLVPEVTLVDDETRDLLARSGKKDLFLSDVSPLGVPFNALRDTPSEKQKWERFKAGKPGSPCPKGHLVSNLEFSKRMVCTASSFYQKRKIEALKKASLSVQALNDAIRKVVTKSCLCEDLAASALIKNNLESKFPLKTAVCPGPNLAYFSKITTLSEMVSHIYGRLNLLNDVKRSNMFINELRMYISYFSKQIKENLPKPTENKVKYLKLFQTHLFEGMDYYKHLIPRLSGETKKYRDTMTKELQELKEELESILDGYSPSFTVKPILA